MLFLVFSFCSNFSMCCLKVRNESRVTPRYIYRGIIMFNYSFDEDYFHFFIFLVVDEMQTANFCLLRIWPKSSFCEIFIQRYQII
jgi:hypothetical protein